MGRPSSWVACRSAPAAADGADGATAGLRVTRTRRIVLKCLAGVGLALGVVILGLWLYPPDLLRAGAGYAAKIVCSNVFLAGRDPDVVLRDDVHALSALALTRASVDRAHRSVRAGFLGFLGNGRAVARPRGGCVLAPAGWPGDASEVLPARAVEGEPPEIDSSGPWPDGERVETDPAFDRLLASETLTGRGARAVLIVHRGRIVGERYAPGFDAQTPQLGWSMTKSVTAGLIGVLIGQGRLALDRQGFWPSGDARARISLADLLAMSSGLRWNEGYGAVSDVTRMLFLEPDMAAFAHAAPLAEPIGSDWRYSSGTAVILARILQDASGTKSLDLPRWLLFDPLGMRSAVIEADAHGTLVGSSYMYATPRDWARYGQFLLQGGVWQGHEILPSGYVAMMTTPARAAAGQYGQGQVWLWGSGALVPGKNPDTAFNLPPDTFWLEGHDNQFIAVIPSREVVVVRLGLTPSSTHYRPQPLVAAVLRACARAPRRGLAAPELARLEETPAL
jgi:CubicO group peptidase (beta-lactamase class C family)